MMATIDLYVNKQKHTIQADPATPLLYILRNQLALNGPKYGCGIQQCGACMVLLDGKAQPSCMLPVEAVKNSTITTLEGLAGADNSLHRVQEAFVREQAAQCGYCSPGFLLAAKELVDKKPEPTRDEIKEALSGNLCRCTGYIKIYEAVELAAARMRGEEIELSKESIYGL